MYISSAVLCMFHNWPHVRVFIGVDLWWYVGNVKLQHNRFIVILADTLCHKSNTNGNLVHINLITQVIRHTRHVDIWGAGVLQQGRVDAWVVTYERCVSCPQTTVVWSFSRCGHRLPEHFCVVINPQNMGLYQHGTVYVYEYKLNWLRCNSVVYGN